MKWLRRYNESQLIKATDDTIWEIVQNEIKKLGNRANLNHIDVSEVTKMNFFFNESKFNGDISKWNVGNVQNMFKMFSHSNFNGDISGWNVSSVIDMGEMFFISPFNGDLSDWNVISVHSMSYMFIKSPLYGREPWWYVLRREFIDIKSMYESIEVHEWINIEKQIIWRKRLNYALQDFGREGYKIPQSIWGFKIQ